MTHGQYTFTAKIMKNPRIKRWVDKSYIDPKWKDESKSPMEMVCLKSTTNFKICGNSATVPQMGGARTPNVILTGSEPESFVKEVTFSQKDKEKRSTTESWLRYMVQHDNINFKDFFTISFHKPTKDLVKQYLQIKHIKNVILDFLYKNSRPDNKVRIWFFVEKEGMFFRQGKNGDLDLMFGGDLHIHFLIENIEDPIKWFRKKSRNITINNKRLLQFHLREPVDIDGKDKPKRTLSLQDLMNEALINHLKNKIVEMPRSKDGIIRKEIGDIRKRLHYVNKSLSSVEFDKWEHIDFEHSDISQCPLNKEQSSLHTYRDVKPALNLRIEENDIINHPKNLKFKKKDEANITNIC